MKLGRNLTGIIELSEIDVTKHYYIHDKTFTVKGPLTDCFGSSFNEKKAWKYFEAHVEGNVKDKYDKNISIDIEDGIKFMYKVLQGNEWVNKVPPLAKGERGI